MKERAEVVTMTKDLVDSLLAMNTKNRNVRNRIVDSYFRDIKEGNWMLTNQGIGISKDGVLIDGQHRLLAIKKAGYPPVKCVIVYGLEEDSQKCVDVHAKRTMRDIFSIVFDAAVSRSAPSICTILSKVRGGGSLKKSTIITPSELFDVFEEYKESIVAVVEGVKDLTFYSAPVLSASVEIYHRGNFPIGSILAFLESVRTGENLNKTMPAFHLRNYILSTKGHGGGGSDQQERYEKTKKAIECFISGKPMGALRI